PRLALADVAVGSWRITPLVKRAICSPTHLRSGGVDDLVFPTESNPWGQVSNLPKSGKLETCPHESDLRPTSPQNVFLPAPIPDMLSKSAQRPRKASPRSPSFQGMSAHHPSTLPPEGAAAPPGSTAPQSPRPVTRLRCPHCHNPITLADDRSDEVLCPGCGSSFRVREARATVSATPMKPLGKFELLERIGVGAFGAVWKARDTALDRIVALKIPHTGLLTAAEDLERFQREARSAAQLRHPGIVPV